MLLPRCTCACLRASRRVVRSHPHGEPNPNPDHDRDCDALGYADALADGLCLANGHDFRDADCNSEPHSNAHADRLVHGHVDANEHANAYVDAQSDGNVDSISHGIPIEPRERC
jgi:hypothetical protein